MSYEEVQFEEKFVQLIPEDLEILSEYSWDMAGYTSRFGFFYLGNTKANVEGLTRWQAEHIFQLTPTPPGMEDELQNVEKSKRLDTKKGNSGEERNCCGCSSCPGDSGKESSVSQFLPPWV